MIEQNKTEDTNQKPKKDRFTRLKNAAPDLFTILKNADKLEMARERVYNYCYKIDRELREGVKGLHPLEWANAMECLQVFQNILARRNEKMTGVSSLKYLWMIARDYPEVKHEKIYRGFFDEFIHILRGMHGNSGLYSDRDTPAFVKHEGRKAAKLRSDELDRISTYAEGFINRYKTGMDESIIEMCKKNKKRILKYFKASNEDWENWKWHVRNIICDSETLSELVEITEENKQAIDIAIANRIPFGITPYYLSLMNSKLGSDYDISIRAQVIPPLNYVQSLAENRESYKSDFDFMLERDTSPIDLITRRYPKIAIFKPYNSCPQICVYCQRNWEIDEVNAPGALASNEKIEAAISWFENHPDVTEVLITGGDPLMLGNTHLEYYIKRFSEMPHIDRIRIGSRTFVTMPMRITDKFVEILKRFHKPERREICIMTHFQHVSEITPDAFKAIRKLKDSGISMYNQQVFTFFVSRRFETMALKRLMKRAGVDPYYTFNTKGKGEMSAYRVPIARILQERREETRLFPGTLRLDEPVYNVPRLGKNFLKGWQNHELIMITPHGKRIYEFHPWEKNINPTDTYFSEDVSIHDYLQELKKLGENTRDYKSIWYYF